MGRAKSSVKEVEKKEENKKISEIRVKKEPITGIRILFQGSSPKLTSRGRGDLFYELGVDDATKTAYIRISGNASSGASSHEWIELIKIQSLLAVQTDKEKSFSAVTMDVLFTRRSANNCGYLAAILTREKVLKILPGKPVTLGLGSWEPLWQKIKNLEESNIHLPDHIAMAAQQRAEKKAQAVAKRLSETEPERDSADPSTQEEVENAAQE